MINKELKKQIATKNAAFELIHDIGFDYDGYETIDGLKSIIDEIVDIANYGLTLEK